MAESGRSTRTANLRALGSLAERYFEYDNTANMRFVVQRMAAPDRIAGETMSADRVERTTDILVANSQRRSGRTHGVEPGTVNWTVAQEQLKGILSPAQIAYLGLRRRRSGESPTAKARNATHRGIQEAIGRKGEVNTAAAHR
jgi:hypothetical protein